MENGLSNSLKAHSQHFKITQKVSSDKTLQRAKSEQEEEEFDFPLLSQQKSTLESTGATILAISNIFGDFPRL